jgi:N-acetylglucosamine-6-phosphate deacetylase
MHHHAAAGPAYDAAIEATGAAAADGTGEEAFERAGHAVHGTTRQVLSLITNPMDVICRNIRTVREKMATRPDILGCHLEGPFLALKRKGAHEPNCLKDPVPELVDRMLDASGADLAAGKLGCIRQITISTPSTGLPNTSGAPAAKWSKLLPAKSTPVPPVFETTSYA